MPGFAGSVVQQIKKRLENSQRRGKGEEPLFFVSYRTKMQAKNYLLADSSLSTIGRFRTDQASPWFLQTAFTFFAVNSAGLGFFAVNSGVPRAFSEVCLVFCRHVHKLFGKSV